LVAQGIDPCAFRQQEKKKKRAELAEEEKVKAIDANTFEVVAIKWFEHFRIGWEDSYSCKVKGRMDRYLFPYIGKVPISNISNQDVLNCIERIVNQGKVETANRIFQILRSIFNYAYAHKWLTLIPMSTDKKLLIPEASPVKMPAITDVKKVGGLLRAMYGYNGTFVVRMALKLLPYVALRSGEFRQAQWKDIDLEYGIWTIPASNRKLKKKQKQDANNIHIVPLSHQAIKLLHELREVTGWGNHVFPSVRGDSRPISENTINSALHSLGYKGEMVGHGFRSIFSTALNEKGYNPDAIERQLAHGCRDKVREAYNRASYFLERKEMMQFYADYLDDLRRGADRQLQR